MSKKILIVDDERDLIETLTFRLEASGYEVVSAYNGREGLDKAREHAPDLILLDIMMPEMDGYKVCKELRQDIKCKDIPVVMVTAKGQDTDRDMGIEAGANGYLTKPFEANQLLDKIKELLNK